VRHWSRLIVQIWVHTPNSTEAAEQAARITICNSSNVCFRRSLPLHNGRPAMGDSLELALFRSGGLFELHQYRFYGLVSGLDDSFAPGDPFRLARGARKLFCVSGGVRVHNYVILQRDIDAIARLVKIHLFVWAELNAQHSDPGVLKLNLNLLGMRADDVFRGSRVTD
jgi:hypothetical protein